MESKFNPNWKSSTQPRKQRKYLANAPLHIRQKLVSAHLSKDLRKKYSTRSIQARKGDKVRILRGSFRKKEGRIERVDLKHERIFVSGVETIKKDGSKVFMPLNASKVMAIDLDLSDRKRKAKLENARKGDQMPSSLKSESKLTVSAKVTTKQK